MRIKILSLIKRQERELQSLEVEYLKRIARSIPCEIVELRRRPVQEGRGEKILKQEKERIEAYLKDHEFVVMLSEKGREVGSKEFALLLNEWMKQGKRDPVFLIGGPLGLSEALSEKVHERLSLSRLTFPHKLARLILVEAIYRSLEILRGGPYPK